MKKIPDDKIATIILAAGQGKRMKNPDLPKVLCNLNNKPLIEYVLSTAKSIGTKKIVVVVGHQKEKLIDFLKVKFPEVETCEQAEQLGTGHAVAQAEEYFIYNSKLVPDYSNDILILAGDVPLISANTLLKFYKAHIDSDADVSVLSTLAPDPTGYGRIVRSADKSFQKIIEHKDASETEKKINEINSGIFLAKSRLLFAALKNVSNKNEQKEYYLTDIIEILKRNDAIVRAFPLADFDELQGVNCVEDLERAAASLNKIQKKN